MLDTKTLVLLSALGNIVFAVLVFIYLRSLKTNAPFLRQWQMAKLILGVSFCLIWLRQFLPQPLQFFNLMLPLLGIAFELSAYWGFFGRPNWRRLPWLIALPIMLAMIVALALDPSLNKVLFCNSLSIGLIYGAMAYLMLANNGKDHWLVRTIGCVNLIGSIIMLVRAGMSLLDSQLVPYSNANINSVMFLMAYVTLVVNGFGFLLLAKQDDDRALQLAVDDLTEAHSRERELLAIASHEFRTPAAIIKASLDSLAFLAEEITPDVAKRLDNIRLACNRLNDFANTLILRDRLLEMTVKSNFERIELGKFVGDMRTAYSAAAVQLTLMPDLPITVNADAKMLRVALHNIIDNAIGHNPSGSEPVNISLKNNLNMVEIRVSDHGSGIPDSEKEKIFERFFSGKDDLTKGIGLSIVLSVAKLHGGKVFTLDNVPQGAILVLALPIAVGG